LSNNNNNNNSHDDDDDDDDGGGGDILQCIHTAVDIVYCLCSTTLSGDGGQPLMIYRVTMCLSIFI